MQVLLDSLRGALGYVLIFVTIGMIMSQVMMLDFPPREQIAAYYAVRDRQTTIVFGGLLMLLTIFGIGVFSYNLWRS